VSRVLKRLQLVSSAPADSPTVAAGASSLSDDFFAMLHFMIAEIFAEIRIVNYEVM